ncbi:toxin-antitoxin system YwqK family antitoxin [Pseudomonas sp. GL-B-19]|uniref:toxin-antitoxin system YwqK family antitoxin n=1 Tax=Pseudomonas sp. GL-B-19 TaxID=2832393 RepID=UPI001CC0E4A9|nr:toxin-antitoxin system YwqK family antitoxin [Pseudomonas sp. GL-B-19]
MQFISWKSISSALLVLTQPLTTYAETPPDHPTVIVGMNPRATYLAKGPEVNGHAAIQLRAAALLTLSTPHACGSNEIYLTPESAGIPDESFRRALDEVQELIDQKIPLLITLSACERKRAFFEKVRPCTPEECGELMTPLVNGKLYLDEHFAPIGKGQASFYLKMPMPYDTDLKAWKAEIFYIDTQTLRRDYFVNAEDFVSGSPVFISKAYYPSGKLRRVQQNDANGLRQGEAITQSENGIVIKRENYLNNKLEGSQTIYHDNGKIAESYNWYQGKRVDGEYPEYDENGALIGSTNYKNDVWDGPAFSYYPSGKLKSRTIFVSGKAQGPSPRYFENGAIETTRDYLDGGPDGWLIDYFISGKTKEKAFYQNGTRRSYARWNEQGIQTFQWQRDEKNRKQGDFKEWFSDGQLRDHKIYKDDKLEGLALTWHDNGQLASSSPYSDGNPHGLSQYWKRDGSLSSECRYEAGVRQGKCTYPGRS